MSRPTHSARVAMMYDKEFLYIGGVFRDPTPLRNAHAFAGEPSMSWNADALQVRLLANPDLKSSASLQTGSRMSYSASIGCSSIKSKTGRRSRPANSGNRPKTKSDHGRPLWR